MRLLDRSGWKDDAYTRLEDVSAGAVQLVSLAQVGAALAGRHPGQRIGVLIPSSTAAAIVGPLANQLDLIAIEFPKTGDGRGFSIARTLREKGYAGTLRATGELMPDQFAFALAAGFDEVEIDEARAKRQPIEHWLAALKAISVHYQGRGSILAAGRAGLQ